MYTVFVLMCGTHIFLWKNKEFLDLTWPVQPHSPNALSNNIQHIMPSKSSTIACPTTHHVKCIRSSKSSPLTCDHTVDPMHGWLRAVTTRDGKASSGLDSTHTYQVHGEKQTNSKTSTFLFKLGLHRADLYLLIRWTLLSPRTVLT